MASAAQIIYSAFNAKPLPPKTKEGVCRLCGGDLIGKTTLWKKRVSGNWTSEGQVRCKFSEYICEACEWAYGAKTLKPFAAEYGRNRGFVARLEKLTGFTSIDSILKEIVAFAQTMEPTVWLLKTGDIRRTVLFIPAVSFPPYLRITFLDGDARAREILACPKQILNMYNELVAIPINNGERHRLVKRSPAGEFVNWLINARNMETKTKN